MAIFHLHIQSIGRSADRSAVSASAYRSASKMIEFDDSGETTKKYNFQNKKGVVFSKIFAPENASVWMRDREALWNIIQNKFDIRVNSVFAQEIDVALPIELSLFENEKLLSEFAEDILVREGMVVDANIHMDNPDNPHAHLMLSTREIIQDQRGEFTFGKKVRFWDRREFLVSLRKSWADYVNKHLKLKGIDIRISHLSNRDRDIDLSPTIKEGTGRIIKNSDRSKINQEILKANQQKIKENPEIIIDILSCRTSLFTRRDIEYEIGRYFGDDTLEITKMVLSSNRIDTVDFRDLEGRILYKDKIRSHLEKSFLNIIQEFDCQNHNLEIEESEIEKDNFFKKIAYRAGISSKNIHLTSAQKEAVLSIVNSSDICLLEGIPGSGKTTSLKEVVRIYKNHGRKIIASAVSSSASNILGEAIGAKAINTTKLRYEIEKSSKDFKLDLPMDYHNKSQNLIDSKTIIIIDEASMVDLAEMHYFVSIIKEKKAKLILVGDRNQLPSIKLKGAYEHLASFFKPIRLGISQRHDQKPHKQATELLANYNVRAALQRYKKEDNLIFDDNKKSMMQNIANEYIRLFSKNPDNKIQALAHRKEDVAQLNKMIREGLKLASIVKGDKKLAIGDRVIFTKNDKNLGIFNNDRGQIISSFGHMVKVRLERTYNVGFIKAPIDVAIGNSYENIDYSYATTIHKAQGSTYDYTLALLDRKINFNIFTVIATRHKKDFKLYIPDEIFDKENQPQTRIEELAHIISKKEITTFESDYNDKSGRELIEEYLESKYLVQKLAVKGEKNNIFEAIKNRKKLASKICNNYEKYRKFLDLSKISYDLIQKHAGYKSEKSFSVNRSNLYYKDLQDLYKSIGSYESIPKGALFESDRREASRLIFQGLNKVKNIISKHEAEIYDKEYHFERLIEKSNDSGYKIKQYNQYIKVIFPAFLKSIYKEKPEYIIQQWEHLRVNSADFDQAFALFQNIGTKRGRGFASLIAFNRERKYANQSFFLLKDRLKLYEANKYEISKAKNISKEEIYESRAELKNLKSERLPNHIEVLIKNLDEVKFSANSGKLSDLLDAYLEKHRSIINLYKHKPYHRRAFQRSELEEIFRNNASKLNPDGKIKLFGNQISCGSLTMNLDNGLWHRFSTGQGGNIYSFLDLSGEKYIDQTRREENHQKPLNIIKKDWVSYNPVPKDSPRFDPQKHIASFLRGKKLVSIYSYKNTKNELIGYTIRLQEGNKKIVLPISYCHKNHMNEWRMKGFLSHDGTKPIYGAQNLRNNKPVLVVEGEKTANEASKLFPNHNVISWLGGSSNANKVNWSILKEKEIYIWPDNDVSGKGAAIKIANKIANSKGSYARIYIIDTDKLNLPEKWDLADKLPDNLKRESLNNILEFTKDQAQSLPHNHFSSESEKRIYFQNRFYGVFLDQNQVKELALKEEKYYRKFDSKTCKDYFDYNQKKGDIETSHEFLNIKHEFYKNLLAKISMKENIDPNAPLLQEMAEEEFTKRISSFSDHIPFISKYGDKISGRSSLYGTILRDIMMFHKIEHNIILDVHKEELAKNLYNILSEEKNFVLDNDKMRIANRAYLELCSSNFYKDKLLEHNKDHEISESKNLIQKQISLER